MTLIKSISGIRGTIGGKKGDNLTPEDVLLFSLAYAEWLKVKLGSGKHQVVIGRDARVSGSMISGIVQSALSSMGIDVIDLGLSTTPTVEMAVTVKKAQGGIILTASHNPFEWNALKLLNEKGEFISDQDGQFIISLAEKGLFSYVSADHLGQISTDSEFMQTHIDAILRLDYVDKALVESRNFKVVVDAVNSTGGIYVPAMLKALGVNNIVEVHCTPNGIFPHNPEPLAENLKDLCEAVVREKADLGIAVDPDVDRLVFVSENGELFGEEYTLVAVADYILSKKPGNTVSNLSSTRALRDVTEKHGGKYHASAVGEVNVVTLMKEVKAVIGGEGNGGIILPDLHYGRDALVGVAIFLTHLANWNGGHKKMSELRDSYPAYYMSKNKIQLNQGMDVQAILDRMHDVYKEERLSTVDGLKIDFADEWVHLRKSNTEPIIRIYTESGSPQKADELARGVIEKIKSLI